MTSKVESPNRPARFPPWLRKRVPTGPEAAGVRRLLADLGLATVCSGARCPNLPECYARGTATFLVLGRRCTRSCRFCAIEKGPPEPLREDEPQAVAEAAARLGLRHVVITSVTRDDLADGGAGHFARTIRAVRARLPQTVIEVLTPDFQGREESVAAVLEARPDIFNHNIETVPRLYPTVRPEADYRRSLAVLACAAAGLSGRAPTGICTKSGLMVGLGETNDELRQALRDLRSVGCDIVTVGQYLQPARRCLPVERYVTPQEFVTLEKDALAMGFRGALCGPLVRSSFHAEELATVPRTEGSSDRKRE